jgi:iron complex transport system substrate-binding protein
VVGRDDSSYYPPEVLRLPSVGYQFRLSAEGILSLRPTLVIGREDVRPPQVVEQLRAAGVTVVLVPTEPTVQGAKAKIRVVAQAVGRQARGEELVRSLERDLLALEAFKAQRAPKGRLRALFLYMRGPQTLFVCGEGATPVGMMVLACLENAARGIRECQPMTAESVVASQPGDHFAVRPLPGLPPGPGGHEALSRCAHVSCPLREVLPPVLPGSHARDFDR